MWTPRAADWLQDRGIDRVLVFDVPMTIRFRSVTSRQGFLLHGPAGWGECAPFLEYEPAEAAQWWQSAVGQATEPAPPPLRTQVPVNVTVPVTDPESAALRVASSGASTAKVKVADPRSSVEADLNRVARVAEVLAEKFGEQGRVRIDVNGSWGKDQALELLERMNQAARAVGGLEYVEQPCASVDELAYVRARTQVPVAADESIRRAVDPLRVVELEAADIAVVKVAPLGGVWPALKLARQLPLPIVVSSALDTSIGLAAGVELAASLPELPYACGLDTGRLLAADVIEQRLKSKDGALSVDQAQAARKAPLVKGGAPVSQHVLGRWLDRGESILREVS